MIKKGSTVKIHYRLKVEEQTIDSSAERGPITYVQGEGQIVPGVEKRMEGLDVGDKKEFIVKPEEGYGAVNPEAIHNVPKTAFNDADKLSVGDMVTGEVGGQTFRARVNDVSSEEITLDLNHPLAGKTLQFAIEVLEVKS
jgi:FKBP-type peptidyl-prolyl cis-trans isomerase SlyD